ncbi:MAG TPA: hypothetical protein VLE89_01335 [Chlamydiales bacterium]|nr:hypothetical protein [Chlamydiales bacterium]
MLEEFKILIDRLKEGQVQKIVGIFDPAFLEVDEPELQFRSPVSVKGEVYLTDADLILRLKANTVAKMPCAICNQMYETEIKIENFYHAEPIAEIPSHIFDFSEPLREALLIELPKYVECNQGKCPERATMTPYLRPETRQDKTTYFPFSDMDLK